MGQELTAYVRVTDPGHRARFRYRSRRVHAGPGDAGAGARTGSRGRAGTRDAEDGDEPAARGYDRARFACPGRSHRIHAPPQPRLKGETSVKTEKFAAVLGGRPDRRSLRRAAAEAGDDRHPGPEDGDGGIDRPGVAPRDAAPRGRQRDDREGQRRSPEPAAGEGRRQGRGQLLRGDRGRGEEAGRGRPRRRGRREFRPHRARARSRVWAPACCSAPPSAIDSVDTQFNTVTFKNADGLLRTVAVKTPRARSSSRASEGDQVEVAYTEAFAIEVKPAG